ncbi:hypothetical protein [Kitasatospora viridis]|uniref:Uncharacterized protein n=1 Tax=Kitasatospora viridis TaxID=281105 RepID=A0A561SE47_9ACTN|nr:hypothetical protein [Kitasatospora viridis]TWF73127.1 hypothetical protein FHX73_16278 [Kitasatospora viridis]
MSASDHRSAPRPAPGGRAAARSSRRAQPPAPGQGQVHEERSPLVAIAARIGELSLFGLFVVLPCMALAGIAFAVVVYVMYS